MTFSNDFKNYNNYYNNNRNNSCKMTANLNLIDKIERLQVQFIFTNRQ